MSKDKKNKEEEIKKECNCEDCNCDDCNCEDGEKCSCDENETDSCNCSQCHCQDDELKKLKDIIIDMDNKVKYNQAELINYRKRKDEEVANMLKFANQDLILELIPIADNFERAIKLESEDESLIKFLDGFKILYSHLVTTLEKFGVEEIESIDQIFDPMKHEALMVSNEEDKENDIVLECFLKGYTLKGKVIRPAKVRVNKLD